MQPFDKFLNDYVKYKLKSLKNLGGNDLRKHFVNHTNGCGAKGGLKFPSTMWGLNIDTACRIHDIDWALATCIKELLEGNEIFDDNLKRIIDYESNFIMKRLRRMRAAKYVTEVELIGTYNEIEKRGFQVECII